MTKEKHCTFPSFTAPLPRIAILVPVSCHKNARELSSATLLHVCLPTSESIYLLDKRKGHSEL
jgi:hypothetical protein